MTGNRVVINLDLSGEAIHEPKATKIQYWYDRTDRSWVVRAADSEGNQVGECEYDGRKSGRDFSIKQLKKEHDVTVVEKLKPVSR